MPRASIHPIEPPPAPMDSTSIERQRGPHPHELAAAPARGLTALDDGHVEARAAHVAGDEVGDVELPRRPTRRRTRRPRVPTRRARSACRRASSTEIEPPAECTSRSGTRRPVLGELGGERVDPGERTLRVRVEQGERRALELADRRVQRGTRDRRDVGERLRERGDRLLLVQRVPERPEERDRERLDLLACRRAVRAAATTSAGIERADDVAVAVDALVDADDAPRRDDLGRRRQPAVVVVDPSPRANDDQLLEALRGDQPDPPTDTATRARS